MRFTRYVTMLLFVLLAGALFSGEEQRNKRDPKSAFKGLTYDDDVIYKTVKGEALALMLFRPTVKKYEQAPIMLYTHGGGWGGGDRYVIGGQCFRQTLNLLLDQGIACASIEYRLTRTGVSTAFDCVIDCKDAARFLMKNASHYGIDVSRMGVWGGSAGGHLSLMTALGPNDKFLGDPALADFQPRFRCVASYFPLTSFINPAVLVGSNFERPERCIPMFGGLVKDHMDLAKLLSPAEHINKDSPPVLLLHGDNDVVLPLTNSTYLHQVGQERGANVQLTVIKGGGHSFSGGSISPSIEEINKIAADFIVKQVLSDK